MGRVVLQRARPANARRILLQLEQQGRRGYIAAVSGRSRTTMLESEHPSSLNAADSAATTSNTTGDSIPGAGLPVRLRAEYVSNVEAAVLSWVTFVLTVVMFAAMIAACVLKFIANANAVLFEDNTWYIVHASIASTVLASLLSLAGLFARNLWLTKCKRRVWTQRRRTLARDAAIGLCIQICSVSCWVAAYTLPIARHCYWFGNAIAWLAMGRWTCLNIQFLCMLVMAHGHTRYRGSSHMQDDYQLVIDAPLCKQLWIHLPKLLLWGLMEGCIMWKTQNWLDTGSDHNNQYYDVDCASQKIECNPPTLAILSTVLLMVFTVAFAMAYLAFLRRAFGDHARLPFVHYRLSNMYLRVMARHGPTAFFTVIMTQLLLQVVHYASCWSYTDMAMGALPIQVAMALMVSVQAILLMPKSPRSKDALMEWLQELSWTQADLASAIERRDYRLRHTQFALSKHLFEQPRRRRYESHTTEHPYALADLGLAPEAASASAKSPSMKGNHKEAAAAQKTAQQAKRQQHMRQREPMFCLELVIRLWCWAQYSYRRFWLDGGMDHGWLMGLFGFTGFGALLDPMSDTHLVLAWNDGTLLLAFRGTASKANAVTDVKAWMTNLLPKRYNHGRLIRVHAGFLQAYHLNEEENKLLDRIAAIVGGFSAGAGLRIYVTGHSLGGALAVLAAQDLARSYPLAEMTVCTFGAPKVGNSAFASEFRKLVKDSWSIINDQDPIPRVPATGFRCCGLRVLINGQGDILVRPSYFERSVVSRSGGNPSHHRMPRYAASIAQVIKAQFSASKALPGGTAGAEALAHALDLGKTLLLKNVDLAALQDPQRQPKWAGAVGVRSQHSEKKNCCMWCMVCDMCEDSTTSAVASLAEEAEVGHAMAAADTFQRELMVDAEAAVAAAKCTKSSTEEEKEEEAAESGGGDTRRK